MTAVSPGLLITYSHYEWIIYFYNTCFEFKIMYTLEVIAQLIWKSPNHLNGIVIIIPYPFPVSLAKHKWQYYLH